MGIFLSEDFLDVRLLENVDSFEFWEGYVLILINIESLHDGFEEHLRILGQGSYMTVPLEEKLDCLDLNGTGLFRIQVLKDFK